MQVRDQGKLQLDDPVKKHLPWFTIKNTFADAPEITIRGILTHSAGLPREADFPYWTGPDYPFPTRDQIMERISTQEELYPAATFYQYSNLGLTLAGEIAAAASRLPYADYVRLNILDPLGLRDTFTEMPEKHRGGRLATGYSQPMRDGHRQKMPFFQARGIAPAAGFASTVEDLSRFASWHFRLLEKGVKEVLAANTLKEMQRVQWLDPDWQTSRGIGYSITRRENKTYVGHGGSCPGYRTELSMSNKDKLAVIVMTNGNEVNPGDYARQILDIAAPAMSKALQEPGKGKITPAELQKFVGRYDRPLGGESHVLPWEGSLAILSVPTKSPLTVLTKLKHIEGNTFRRIRDDGELGEAVIFELGPDGQVTRLVRNSNYSIRVN